MHRIFEPQNQEEEAWLGLTKALLRLMQALEWGLFSQSAAFHSNQKKQMNRLGRFRHLPSSEWYLSISFSPPPYGMRYNERSGSSACTS